MKHLFVLIMMFSGYGQEPTLGIINESIFKTNDLATVPVLKSMGKNVHSVQIRWSDAGIRVVEMIYEGDVAKELAAAYEKEWGIKEKINDRWFVAKNDLSVVIEVQTVFVTEDDAETEQITTRMSVQPPIARNEALRLLQPINSDE